MPFICVKIKISCKPISISGYTKNLRATLMFTCKYYRSAWHNSKAPLNCSNNRLTFKVFYWANSHKKTVIKMITKNLSFMFQPSLNISFFRLLKKTHTHTSLSPSRLLSSPYGGSDKSSKNKTRSLFRKKGNTYNHCRKL